MGVRRPPLSEGSTQLQWKGESTEESAYCLGALCTAFLLAAGVPCYTDTARRAAYKYGKAVPRAAHPLGAYPGPRARDTTVTEDSSQTYSTLTVQ